MEVRMMTIEKIADCPFSGTGMVLVWPGESLVRLMHPLTLAEWTMPIRDHLNQQGTVDKEGFVNSTRDEDLLWPVNQSKFGFSTEKLVAILRRSFQRHCLYEGVPDGATWVSVKEALVDLQGITPEEVEVDLRQLEESTHSMPKPRGAKVKQPKLEGTMVAKKKSAGHREGVLYCATAKLDPEKFRGQRQLVAKALGSYSTPKDLSTIVEKVEKNGGYKVSADGGLTDSVHFHLRELVKSNLVKETKVDEPKKEAVAPKKSKAEKEEATDTVAEDTPEPVGV